MMRTSMAALLARLLAHLLCPARVILIASIGLRKWCWRVAALQDHYCWYALSYMLCAELMCAEPMCAELMCAELVRAERE